MNQKLQKLLCKSKSAVFLESHKKIGDVIPANSLYRQNILTQLAMDISDRSESLSFQINTDGSFESGDFDTSKMIFCVVFLKSRNIMGKN